MKKLLSFLALFAVSLLIVPLVCASNALPVSIEQLKINGNTVTDENLYVEEGKTLNIEVKVKNIGTDTAKDLEVEAAIKGYEYSDYESLEDATPVFDLEDGDSRWVDLSVKLPYKLDKDLYLLRVRVTDRNSEEVSKTFNLKVNPVRHGTNIADVIFFPGTTVKAGHSLLTTVLIDNLGKKDEQDIKVTVELPDLGVSASKYVSEIESGDKKTSEELFLKLPQCVAEGDYTAVVTLNYDEGYETTSKEFPIHITENEKCMTAEQKLIITVGPETQNVVANQKAVYPVALTNAGKESASFTLDLAAGEWANAQLSENLVVLEPGKTKVVFAYLTPNEDATAGEKVATLTIKSDDSVLKTIYLNANVVPQEKSFSLRNGLEIALIVLVVILVILGLILGFSRLKKDDEDLEEGEDKTYY